MAFSHYTDVTIQSSKIDSDQTDLVITINGSDLSTDFFSTAKSDGGDIRAYDVTETTEYPIHIAFYDNVAEKARIIVRNSGTTSSSSNTVIRLMYGDAALSMYAVDATYGQEAVWANALFALPFGDEDWDDKSATGCTMATNSATFASSSVYDGSWAVYNIDATRYTEDVALNVGNNFTYTMWAYVDADYASGYSYFMSKGWQDSPYATNGMRYANSSNKYGAISWYNSSTNTLAESTTTDAPATNLRLLGHSFSSGRQISCWVDGVKETTNAAVGADVDNTCDTSQAIQLGRFRNTYHYYKGKIDMLVKWNTELAGDYMLALYRNQDTTTFYSVGTHTAAPPPPSSASAPIVVVLL